jgi:hypothetical protein
VILDVKLRCRGERNSFFVIVGPEQNHFIANVDRLADHVG